MSQNDNCLCCKTFFQDGERLPLQDLVIQLKNYTYPIKDQKHKWILLKTIVSMLNSRGGTIFIGAEDKTGEVRGLTISRKQQDQFKLFLQKLTEKIQPVVDLSNREDIIMHFLPIMRQGTFTGRFLAKIIVKQGDPTKLYCFSQKVVLQTVNEKKYDDFQVVYTYKRINMGSVKQLSGYEVVAEAAYRAINPPKIVNIFHEGCNPQPKSVANIAQAQKSPHQTSPKYAPKQVQQVPQQKLEDEQQQDITLQFANIRKHDTRQKLQDQLDEIMDQLHIKHYNISYDDENATVVLQFTERSGWNKAMDFIDANLNQLNEKFGGLVNFTKRESEQDYAVYFNEKKQYESNEDVGEIQQINQPEGEQEASQSLNKQKQRSPSPPQIQKRQQSIEQQVAKNEKNAEQQYQIKIISQRKGKQSTLSSHQYVQVPSTVDIANADTLTITHINPSRKQQLIEFIQSLSDCKKKIQEYEKTIEVSFQNQESFYKCYDKFEKSKDLAKFGFRGILRFGINVGQITLQNYDRKKYRQFKTFITKLVGDDIKRCEFNKKNDKYSLILTLKSAQKAAQWLDKIVSNKETKDYKIPGGVQTKKMKIDLVCVKPKKSMKQSKSEND